ncbi:MAG TPA: molybdopterin-binding protein, partial [Novosphingobium sp.]|nr:molybdopterin-binding protein [Novosphingobium sp.]
MAVDPARPFKAINIALLSVSDTRDLATDTSGDILAERIRSAGHNLVIRAIEKDDVQVIANRLNNWIDDRNIDCVITTG